MQAAESARLLAEANLKSDLAGIHDIAQLGQYLENLKKRREAEERLKLSLFKENRKARARARARRANTRVTRPLPPCAGLVFVAYG